MGIFRRMLNPSEEEPDDSVSPSEEDQETVATAPIAKPGSYVPDGATRQLPSIEEPVSTDGHLMFGQSTDVGLVRHENQDSVFSSYATVNTVFDSPDFGIFIVADGMGGHFDGKQASTIAVRTVVSKLNTAVYTPMLSTNEDQDTPPITEILVESIQEANENIYNTITKGGGTTCTAVIVLGNRAYIGHVGDSRAYLLGEDHIEQLTRDHSTVQRLVEVGQMTKEEAALSETGNVLYRALGIQGEVEVDVFSRRLPENCKLLICSDGLWNLVDDETILEIVSTYPDPQDACNKLVALANVNGGKDNISVIILHIN